jgi:hypothetical protein
VGYQDQVCKNSRYSSQPVSSCFCSLRVLILKISRVPLSENNFTYLFTPQSTIRPLFDDFDLPFPQNFEQPLNFSKVVHPNDTLPNGLDTTGISMGGETLRIINRWLLMSPFFPSDVLE